MNNLSQARKLIKECKETQNPHLDLGNCGITNLNDLPELFECLHIETLILSSDYWVNNKYYKSTNIGKKNILSFIPKEISNFKKITKLIIGGDFIDKWEISDIRFLENLTGLQSLYLRFNQISDIRFLENLTGLQSLYLTSNQISDIRFLENLTGLQYLDLSSNKLKEIPESIFKLNMDINMNDYGGSGLCLYGNNSLESPSMEIVRQGKEAVLDWFEAKKQKLSEIKIILIGEPKAGKTSLLKRLKDDTFDKNEVQTDGVNIEDITFGKCKTFKKQTSIHGITGHFWDFGGQEIMNATHQFFLTKRSVYVLVLDARKDAKNSAQISDWVKRVRATGGDSPIIVLVNQIDVNSGFGFENQRELQEEFPQIKCFIKVSCKTKENIEELKNKLTELIPTAELFQTEIDEKWITIKNKLQKETKEQYYLNEKRFIDICNEAGLTEAQQRHHAINFLHDLGLVLHFEDLNQNLSEYYVLNPYWITYGAYQILTSKYAGDQKGIVSMDKLNYIVNEEKDKKDTYQPANYKKITYSPNERRFLIDILHEFKLCFRMPDNNFIIPDLLDTTEPLDFTEPVRSSGESIQFVYEYDYLPKSVMPNIMVETHRIITAMWRTGCILQSNDCKALITNYKNRISITVTGEYKKKREFMAVVRFTIDLINQKISSKINYLIPLQDVKDGFADYERLLMREKNGKTDYIFDEDMPTEKRFLISELLDGIPSEEEVRFSGAQYKILLKSIGEINDKLDSYFDDLVTLSKSNKDEIINAVKEINAQQTEEITKEIADFFNKFDQEMDDKLDDKLKEIYNDIKKTDDFQMKLKLSIPFISLLGINFETEFDVKNWAKKMYKKYELNLFKLMGAL